MSSPDARTPVRPPAALLPAGRRWGVGMASITPYLRDAWSMRPRHPVFTPAHIAAVVWPAKERVPGPRSQS